MRPIQDNDTENIVRWRNNEIVRSQFIFREAFTSEIHFRWLNEKVYHGCVIQYIIEVDDIPIGSVYLRDIDLNNESGEFGIFIGETEKIGKGLGKKTAQVFTQYCFNLGFHRIFLRVLSSNKIAMECYKKAGFEIEGIAREMVFIDGFRHDVIFMSMINQ